MLTQDLTNSKMFFWVSHGNVLALPAFARFRGNSNIMFRPLHLSEHFTGTCIANLNFRTASVQGVSDLLRLALLRKYGGIWVDTDSVRLA